MTVVRNFSKIKEVVAGWDNIRQMLRSGDGGALVPVVIPKDRRRLGWLIWAGLAFYTFFTVILLRPTAGGAAGALLLTLPLIAIAAYTGWRNAIVERHSHPAQL